jgi:hypothetical protein
VKQILPILALLILGICFSMHRGGPELRTPFLPAAKVDLASQAPQVIDADRVVKPMRVETAKGSESPTGGVNPIGVAPASSPSGPQFDIGELLSVLRVNLELTEEQEPAVAAALRGRASDLQESQEAIRKSGVFTPREYGQSLLRMKETWYRNVDSSLDSSQHRRFQELVSKGFFRPGTEFTADLKEMIVLH